jgi:sulfur-carrier protein
MDNSDLVKGLAVPAQAAGITVLYFARLKEALGLGSERVALPDGIDTVAALRDYLHSRGGAWEVELAAGRPVRVAVNQEMAVGDMRIVAGDEIAFFPPVTGG